MATTKVDHTCHVERIGDTHWQAQCRCGWTGMFTHDREFAETQRRRHEQAHPKGKS